MTDAIVLKTSPYSESTLIVWLLTRDEGVVRVLAKGARRIKGHTAAALDLFSHVGASLRMPAREGLGILRSVDLKRAWSYLRADLKLLSFASLALEIIGAVAGSSAAESYFLDEALEYLQTLESSAAPGSLTAALLLRLLHHAGYPPRLADEIEVAALPDQLAYDFAEGTIVPSAASHTDPRRLSLPRRLVEQLIPALRSPPPLDGSFVISSREGAVLLRWLVRVWEDHLNQRIHSAEFVEKVVLNSRSSSPPT